MRRLLLAPMLGGAAVLATMAAGATPLVDQEQSGIDRNAALAIGDTSQQKVAQVVTAGLTGTLIEVRFPVACAPTADLIVEVQGVTAGKPDGVVRTSQTIPGAGLPLFTSSSGPSFRSLAFSTPVPVTAGLAFAVTLRSTGLSSASSCGVVQGPVGDPYPGGNALYMVLVPAATDWVCLCALGPGGRFDLPFQTLVEPAGAKNEGPSQPAEGEQGQPNVGQQNEQAGGEQGEQDDGSVGDEEG